MEVCTGGFETAMPEPCSCWGYWPQACAEHSPEALPWLRYGLGLAWLRARVYLVCNNAGSVAPAAMHDLLSGGCQGNIVMPWAGCTMHESLAGLPRRRRRLRRFARACPAAGGHARWVSQFFAVFVLRAGDASRGSRRREGARAGRGRLVCRGRCTNTPFDPLLACPAAVLPGGCGLWGCLTLTCPVCLSACRPTWARPSPQAHAQARLCTLNFAGCWQPGRCSCMDALCKRASLHSIELNGLACKEGKINTLTLHHPHASAHSHRRGHQALNWLTSKRG